MIGCIILLSTFAYMFITMFLLAAIDQLSFVNSKFGMLKFFGWPVYFPLKAIKEIGLFLYCDVFIRALDKIFEKK